MNRVTRIYVEKRPKFDIKALELEDDLRKQAGISKIERVRVLQRYDFYHPGEDYYKVVKDRVFSDPATDIVHEEKLPDRQCVHISVEYLPGQFDARAEAASQAAALVLDRPAEPVRCAQTFLLYGRMSEKDIEAVRTHLINPVDSREASEVLPLDLESDVHVPKDVPVLKGFTRMESAELGDLRDELGLAMGEADIDMIRDHYASVEKRDPSLAELKVLDTYWSDHCRHTTFSTSLEEISIDEDGRNGYAEGWSEHIGETIDRFFDFHREEHFTLMDLALAGMRLLKKRGKLSGLEESEEVNAASVEIEVSTPGGSEPWLLMFKNETHNHPTEIEPFGGAATCLGGAIRDPLSGRAYVYQAMRLSGSADPRVSFKNTRKGKLPQRVITTGAARGYSSYGNQVGIPAGYVHELYHPGFEAKRMEVGAVIGAVPKRQVRRERPVPGDSVLLIGGDTGRDGIGGAAGSSKKHHSSSLETAAAEVQKGNPLEERALQRLFRDPGFALRVKRSNDFGAGGVSVAVGELADGLEIELDQVPVKYRGLDGIELALSESQERMAVVVSPEDVEYCICRASEQNLKASVIAQVLEEPRLRMQWRGERIIDISRSLLDSGGASRSASAVVESPASAPPLHFPERESIEESYISLVKDLSVCSRQGLVEMFDGTVGGRSVLMPFGGKHQLTPAEGMAAKIPVPDGETETVSIMSAGYDPLISSWSPYHGGIYAVVEAVGRAVACGAPPSRIYLSFQEYFRRMGEDPSNWGIPAAALLGAFRVQEELEIASVGGKDSMSGSFEELNVPPVLAAFAVASGEIKNINSPEFKTAGSEVLLFEVPIDGGGFPDLSLYKKMINYLHELIAGGYVVGCRSLRSGGIAAALAEMSFGNQIGVDISDPELWGWENFSKLRVGSFLGELAFDTSIGDLPAFRAGACVRKLGKTTGRAKIQFNGRVLLSIEELLRPWQVPLEDVFPLYPPGAFEEVEKERRELSKADLSPGPQKKKSDRSPARRPAASKAAGLPKVCIPVFPGTNCEEETARQFGRAGAAAELPIFRWKSFEQVEESISELASAIEGSHIFMLPGGFSAGDEPDGSAKYIAAVLRSPAVKEALEDLLCTREGLVLGICNGFQALIRTGLLPFGEYRDPTPEGPALVGNIGGRHVSRYIRTVTAHTDSPWLQNLTSGEVHTLPVSHGDGRFTAAPDLIEELFDNGQVVFRYCDESGVPADGYPDNPNGSAAGIEGIMSPDGRILGKMAHSERIGRGVAVNIPGDKNQKLFESAVRYFTA
ncbi:MAG: phosphoribosylformylglycinamidine synthase [Spirochaetia bacterium]